MTYLDPLAQRIRDSVAEDVGVPDDSDLLFALYAMLARAKGADVTGRDVHDAWVVWMQSRGEQHRSMVPFDDLDESTQREDEPFVMAIREALHKSSAEGAHSGTDLSAPKSASPRTDAD